MTELKLDTPRVEYDEMKDDWRLADDLQGGTRAMRGRGKTYLPQMKKESNTAYEDRLNQTYLFNAYSRTIETLVGKPLDRPITVGDDVPEEVNEWLENIDLQGRDVDVFAWTIFTAAFDHGLTHVLIDFPTTATVGTETPTLLQEQQAGVRPYACHIPADRLIGWRSAVINGQEVLTQIRILETGTIDVGDYAVSHIQRIRVINIGSYEIWEMGSEKNAQWQLVEEGTLTIDFIPLVTLYIDQTGFMQGRPALIDLANLNVAHWQSSSDQRNILHVARVPMLFASGMDDDAANSLEIGANRIIYGPEGSSMQYVEHGGSAISAGRQDLEDLKGEMATMGMEFLVRRPGNMTATAASIDKAEGDSALLASGRALSNTLTNMLDYMGRWMNRAPGSMGTLSCNTDFKLGFGNDQDLDVLMKARQFGDISRRTFWQELSRRNVLDEGFDPDKEEAAVEDEGTSLLEQEAQFNEQGIGVQESDQGSPVNVGGVDTGVEEG